MEHIFNRVIVLLNDLNNIEILLKKAMDFSVLHKTVLEIVYVHEEPLFDIPDFFLSDESIAEDTVDEVKIKKLIQIHLEALNPTEEHAVFVFIDDTVDRLLTHAKDTERTLIVTDYHEEITPALMVKTSYSYWIIKGEQEVYEKMLLPLDLKENAGSCIETAKHMFADIPMTLVHDYRYILDVLTMREDYLNVVPLTTSMDLEFNERLKVQQKEILETYKKEYGVEGHFIESEGLLDEDLIEYIQKEKFNLTVLYHNNEELFFSPVLIMDLIEELSTDFFICKL
ncbi:hypothetical protein KKC13_13230 [bacterium]|nr:hypothetical protein [bacterium]MBU1957702.1 hypothetical protein [bacterium]